MWEILGGAALGAAGSIFNNERNLTEQRRAQDYTKWLNQATWEREDNAVQRRVADLKKAGLSPVLAAGSSAQAGQATKIDPAMSQDSLGAEGAISGFTKAAQTQQTIAATAAAKQQVNNLKAQEQNIKADTTKKAVETGILTIDKELYNATKQYPRTQTSDLMKVLKLFATSDTYKKLTKGKNPVDLVTPEALINNDAMLNEIKKAEKEVKRRAKK